MICKNVLVVNLSLNVISCLYRQRLYRIFWMLCIQNWKWTSSINTFYLLADILHCCTLGHAIQKRTGMILLTFPFSYVPLSLQVHAACIMHANLSIKLIQLFIGLSLNILDAHFNVFFWYFPFKWVRHISSCECNFGNFIFLNKENHDIFQ